MKKRTLIRRLLTPTIIILFIIPPISCLIFFITAKNFAYEEAIQNLLAFQEDVIPTIDYHFNNYEKNSNKSLEKSPTNPYGSIKQDVYSKMRSSTSFTEQEVEFLYDVSPLAARMGDDARLMILDKDGEIIYPRDEESRYVYEPLAKEFITFIEGTDVINTKEITEYEASDGESYLMNVYKTPDNSPILEYVVAYCPSSEIGNWVQEASKQVLIISSLLGIVIFGMHYINVRSINREIKFICQEVERIGNGNFAEINDVFTMEEIEALRLATNRTCTKLLNSDIKQKSFFQNVSHELRSPLMSIGGYAQGIEQDVFDKPKEAAHIILDESVRLTNLVNSLLTLSQAEGDMSDVASPINIIGIIEDSLDRVNGVALQKGIKLLLETSEYNANILLDEELMSKMLDNLLTNAIRYAHSSVIVRLSNDKDTLCLSVVDDGEGIAENDLPFIFDRCYKGKNGNFGLGLSIAQYASQKLNGEIIASNSINGGAIFTFSMKLSDL